MTKLFEEAIAVATSAAPAFGAERAALCVESQDGAAPIVEHDGNVEPGALFQQLDIALAVGIDATGMKWLSPFVKIAALLGR